MIIATFLFFSFPVQAGSLSASTNGEKKANGSSKYNSQTLPLLQAQVMPDVIAAQGGGDITVVQDSALIPETGPLGTPANSKGEDFSSDQIFNYVVRKGDTVAALSKMFGVSVNTILWANNLSRSQALKEGDILLILPVSGVRYTVQKGDTIQGIAKKFKADAKEIISFNELTKDSVLSVGDVIIIPDGEITAPVYAGTYTRPVRGAGGPDYSGYYIWPVAGGAGHRSQNLHGYNGVDIGAPYGTLLVASATGNVLIADDYGYNGGYGQYVVISHDNGTQTLYAHMSSVSVSVGQRVFQGQVIGTLGNSGRSTGPHVHFEVRGAKNPFAK